MNLGNRTALAAVLLAPMVSSTNGLFELPLFPQAVAAHLLLWSLATAWPAVREGRRALLPAVLVALTGWTDPIYGCVAALSICVLAAMPPRQLRRAVWIVMAAVFLTAFHWLPFLLDRWQPAPRSDSFGAAQILKWLVTGKLLDDRRLPVLTLLAAAGAILYLRQPRNPAHRFVLVGAAFWIALSFGHSFWGPVVPADAQFSRVIAGAHIFLVLLAAISIAALWDELTKRRQLTAAVAATALLMFPMVRERVRHLRIDQVPAIETRTPDPVEYEFVDVGAAVTTSRNSFREINDRWLKSEWPARHVHLLLDWNAGAPPDLLRVYPYNELPQPPLRTVRYALFKTPWHRNWKAYVDGAPQRTVMLSPGAPAVAVPAGSPRVELRYEPPRWPLMLAVLAVVVVLLVGRTPRSGADALVGLPPHFASLLLLTLPICIPLLTTSLINGHDAFSYFPRVVEVHQNVIHGIYFPRWAPDLDRGAGQPLFLFHPPLFYWIAEFWHLLGFQFVTAVNLACVVLVLAAAAGMFLLGRLYFGTTGGYLAAAAYIYAPYFATDLYVRSALEEFTALAFFPLALYGFSGAGHRFLWPVGAAAYAAIVYSHLPTALIFTPILLAFILLTGKSLIAQACTFLLALGLSAAIWLPVLLERQYVSLARATEGYAHYANHFVYLRQLFYSPWGYGYSGVGPDDGMAFIIGWSHILVAILAWIWIELRRDSATRMARFFAAAAIVFCILMLQSSARIWELLRPLQYVQLPWRMLGPVTFCTAILAASLGPVLASRRLWMAVVLALLIVPNLSHLRPGQIQDIDPTFWTPEELAKAGFDTVGLGEMQPRWMESLPPYNPRAVTAVSGKPEIRELHRTPFEWSAEIIAPAPTTLEMSRAYFPGWRVNIDGQPASFEPSTPHGLILFHVPPGTHRVEVAWSRSPIRLYGEIISAISLAFIVFSAVFSASQRLRVKRNPPK